MWIDIYELPFYVWAIFGLCIVLIVVGIVLLATRSGRAKREAMQFADGKVHKMSDLSFGFDTLEGREEEPEEEPEEEQLPVFNQQDPTVPATPVGPYTSWDYHRTSGDKKEEANFAGYIQAEEPVRMDEIPFKAQDRVPVRPESEILSVPESVRPETRESGMKAKEEEKPAPKPGLRAEEQLLLFKSHELLLTLTDGLKKIAATKSEETRKEKMAELMTAVKLLDAKSEWEEYKACFEKLYPGFWTTMEHTAHEAMTPYELRLSALLSLGMGTKEIAELTNRSVRTVETTIYKIRKKLNMDGEEKTQDFLARLRNA